MIVYILLKKGIYYGEILEVHTDFDRAKKAAERLMMLEEDGWHDIEIHAAVPDYEHPPRHETTLCRIPMRGPFSSFVWKEKRDNPITVPST